MQTVIRPETVDVSLQQSDHRVTGKVETISYLGERYEGTLKIANTDVVLHFYSTKRIETGTTVYVRIHSDQIHVLQSKGGAYETA
nr:TOBE domain-containing protein [Evansella caseinilytica]